MGTHISSESDIRRVLDSLRQIVQVLRLSASEAKRKSKLTAAQLFVLHKLGAGQGISMNELATRTHTHQSSVSVVVQRLVDKRLVRRRKSTVDARQVELQLTSAGIRKLKAAPEAAQDRLIESLSRMPPLDRSELVRLLDQFVRGTGMAVEVPRMIFEDEERKTKRGTKSNG